MKKLLLILPILILCGCASPLSSKWSPFAAVKSYDPSTGETNTVWGVNPKLTSWMEAAQDVNAMANPTPTAPIINLALTGISLFLAAYAKKQRDKARLVDPIIEGIERSGSKEAKESIHEAALKCGVGDRLHQQVKAITK